MIPSTLKLIGLINGQNVMALIDGDSTNNLIQSFLGIYLSLAIHPSPHLHVTIGNNKSLSCGSECCEVPLKLGCAMFTKSILLLPIHGAYLVLELQWLSKIGQPYLITRIY